ncbi:MAG: hypothetical protein GY808_14360 [Gammaproteobacteria bacterium]|nr:hypothetical protein [Gammaproteobacteria bacterium]
MSAYQFSIARKSDDKELRQLIGSISTPGDIELVFRRDPDFFHSLMYEGEKHQVMVASTVENQQIVGCGVRSIQERFVDGKPVPIGYLSSLRLKQAHRGRALAKRAYQFLHQLHQDGSVPYYLTAIADGNDTATRLLTSNLRGMAKYHPLGAYYTLAMHLGWRRKKALPSGLSIRAACDDDLVSITRFINEEGAKRTFAHYYSENKLFGHAHLLGLKSSDLALAFRDGALVGVLGGWDQHAYRQTILHRYNGVLRNWRWLYDIGQLLNGAKALPKPGQPFRYRVGALCMIKDWDNDVFCSLLRYQVHLSRQGPYHYFLLGMHETDPLLTDVRDFSFLEYKTNMYAVNWEEAPQSFWSYSTPLYMELGCL